MLRECEEIQKIGGGKKQEIGGVISKALQIRSKA
jgi:hypothetical protein